MAFYTPKYGSYKFSTSNDPLDDEEEAKSTKLSGVSKNSGFYGPSYTDYYKSSNTDEILDFQDRKRKAEEEKKKKEEQEEIERKAAEERAKNGPQYGSIWERIGDKFEANSPQDQHKRVKEGRPELNEDKRGVFEKAGDAFEANSPEDKAKRAARGDPELYQDQKKQEEEDRKYVSEAQIRPEDVTDELRSFIKQNDKDFDIDRYVNNYDKYKFVHDGLKDPKSGLLKDKDLKAMAEEAERDGLFEGNEKALEYLKGAREYEEGSNLAKTFYAKAITSATPELSRGEDLNKYMGRLQTLLKQEAGDRGNIVQQAGRNVTTGIGNTLGTMPSGAQTIASTIVTAVAPEGSRLDKYAKERYDDATRDALAVEEKLFNNGMRTLEGDGFTGQLFEGAGSLVSALAIGGAFTKAVGGASQAASASSWFARSMAATKAFAKPSVVGALFGIDPAAEVIKGAKENGLSDWEALAFGLPTGYISGALENWGVGAIFNRFGAGFAVATVKNTISEGSQEFMQEMVGTYGQAGYRDIDFGEAIAASWQAALVGGVLGAASGVTGFSGSAKQEAMVENLQKQGMDPVEAEKVAEQYDDKLRQKAAENAKKLEESEAEQPKSVIDVKPPEAGPSKIPGANKNVTPPTEQESVNPAIQELQNKLPKGYTVDPDGSVFDDKGKELTTGEIQEVTQDKFLTDFEKASQVDDVKKMKEIAQEHPGDKRVHIGVTNDVKPVLVDENKLKENEASDNQYRKESLAQAKTMSDQDAYNVAVERLRNEVERGDTLSQIKSGMQGGTIDGGRYSVGGYIDGKKVPSDFVVVELDDGRTYKFKLKDIAASVTQAPVESKPKGKPKTLAKKTKPVKKLGKSENKKTKSDIDIIYPEANKLPDNLKERMPDKETNKLTPREVEHVVGGMPWNKTATKDFLKSVPALKENPVLTVSMEKGQEPKLTYDVQTKTSSSSGSILLSALGINNTDVFGDRTGTVGLKDGMTVNLGAVLKDKGRVPVLRNNETGVEGFVEENVNRDDQGKFAKKAPSGPVVTIYDGKGKLQYYKPKTQAELEYYMDVIDSGEMGSAGTPDSQGDIYHIKSSGLATMEQRGYKEINQLPKTNIMERYEDSTEAFKARKQLPRKQVKSAPLDKRTPDQKEAEQLEGLNKGIETLAEAFDVPVRFGRMRMRQALGEHHTKEEIIRLRKVIGEDAVEGGRFGVAAHEMGHNMAKNIPEFKLTKGVGIAALDKKGNADLSSISTKPNGAGLSGVYGEGFAEFMRYYVVNPESLVEKMPKTYGVIDDILRNNHVETYKALMRARNLWTEYQSTSATKRLMSQISYGKDKLSAKDRITTGLPKLYSAAVNDLYYIEHFEKMALEEGANIDKKDLPSTLATVYKGVYGKAKTMLEYGTFGADPYNFNEKEGKWELETTGKSYKEITQPIFNEGQEYIFDSYLLAKRAISIKDQKGMEVGVTYKDSVAAITEMDKQYPHFAKAQKELVQFNEQVMDYVIETGLLSKEQADTFRKMNDNYVPLFKVMEGAGAAGYFGKGFADISQQVKRMKGSEAQIISPLESIVKNTMSLVSAAEANKVGQALVKVSSESKYAAREFERIKNPMAKVATVTLDQLGVEEAMKRVASIDGVAIVEEADIQEAIDIFRPMFQDKSEQIVSVRVNGQQQFYRVADKDLYRSIMGMDEEQSAVLLRMLGAPAKLLRAGATLTPEFVGRNPIRDQFAAFVYSKTDYIMGIDLAKGVGSAIKKDGDYWLWQASGGPYATLVSMDRDYARNELQSISKGSMSQRLKHKQQRRDLFKERINPLRSLRDFSEVMENATRLGEFKEGIKNHKSLGRDQKAMHPTEAALASKEITLDFSRAGWAGRKVNTLSAFFNAGVQDVDKFTREMKNHPYRTSLKASISITLPSLMLYFMNRDEEWYKELPDWRKDLAWNFKVGDTIWSIPKPFLLGTLFGTLPERIAGELTGDDDRSISGISDVIWNAIPDPMPTAVNVPVEIITNYDMFTGRTITPSGEEYLDPSLQYGAYTSETAKVLSSLTGGVINPREADHIISGYFAGLGRYGTAAADKALDIAGRETTPGVADEPWTDIPVLKGFAVRSPYGVGSESVNNFYKGLDRATTAERTAKFLEDDLDEPEKAQKWREEHPEYALASSYRKIGESLTDINRAIKTVQRSKDMTPTQKREEIDKLSREMTYVAQQALRFDPMYSKEDLTPLPPTTNDARINAAIAERNTDEALKIMNEHNEQLDKYLEDLGDFMTDEQKEKIRKSRRINLTPSSIRTRYKNSQKED